MGSKLVGLISNRDTDFLDDRTKKISDLMTPIEKLVVGLYPLSIDEANQILKVLMKISYIMMYLLYLLHI